MHKKKIKNITYYYTSTRENGKVKTIYLGKDSKTARKKEKDINGNNSFSIVKIVPVIIACLLLLSFGVVQMTGMLSADSAEENNTVEIFSPVAEDPETHSGEPAEKLFTVKSYYYGFE